MAEATVCRMNIGPRERRKRAAFGLVMVAVGLVLAVALWALGVSRTWRLVVFAPLWIGALGVFQARAKT